MKKGRSIFWGLIIILVGVIWFGNSFAVWHIDIFFDGWWTLFIIVPSIYGLFKHETYSSILGIILGFLLLLAEQNIIAWKSVWATIFPLLLVVFGLTLIFKPKTKTKHKGHGQLPEYVSVFSDNKNVVTDNFLGSTVVSVFGALDLDLTKAIIKEDIVIECVAIFGGINIIVSDDIKIKTEGVPIFGGIDNKIINEKGHTVTISYVSVFGGIEIKNK